MMVDAMMSINLEGLCRPQITGAMVQTVHIAFKVVEF